MEDALIITITLLGWVSETVEDGDFVPFRAMPSQATPLGNKIILCPVWICILKALKRCHFHCIIQPFLVGWKTCWATLYLGGFSPLFIFLISPASICTSGSNSVLCDLRVTFLNSYEISVTGRSVNVWEIEMNLDVAVKKITILRAQPLPIWAQCQSFTGLWFPTKVDKAIWVQLFHLDNLWRSQGRSRGKPQELNSVLLQFLTKNWDQEHLSLTGDGCSTLKKGLWCPVYLLLHVRLYPKLLRCVPIFARKDRMVFIWWLHCILPLGRGA